MKSIKLLLMVCSFITLFSGCGKSSKYKVENRKVYFIYYAGPLPMFGLNFNRHKCEIPEADAATFVDFRYATYAKDKHNVYHFGKIYRPNLHIDAPTFEITGDYGKDKNHVYYLFNSQIVDSVDVPSFKGWGLNTNRGKDKYHLFCQDKIHDFQPQDIASYELVKGWQFGRDKYHYYFGSDIMDVDYSSFCFLSDGYAKDKYRVYYYYLLGKMEVIKGADPKTFKVLTSKRLAEGVAKDKNNYYIGMKKATKKEVDKHP